MKRLVFLILIFTGSISLLKAQEYSGTGVGIRMGNSFGVSVKHYINSNSAIEGIIASRYRGFELTALYEFNKDFPGVKNFGWFFGGGGHIGYYEVSNVEGLNQNKMGIGVDGIIGLSYIFDRVPINLSIDWKPEFNFSALKVFKGDTGAFSVRYFF